MLWRSASQVLRQVQDRYARAEQQCRLQAQRHLVMQQVFPPVGHDKFRHDHRQGILRIALMHRINISEDWAEESAVRRLNDEQMGLFLCCDLVLPLLPVCTYLLYLLLIGHYMHRYDVTRDGASIGQTRDRRTIQPRHRHNETVTYLLWTSGNSSSAGYLM